MHLPIEVAALLDAAADRHGIAHELARAVAWIESNGKQSAVSPVGALGIMQLMPDTAAGLGIDPHDAAQNIEGGVRYLAKLVSTFGERAGLAAYNWGPGAKDSHHRARLLAGDWPPGVQGYVNKVQKRAAWEVLPDGPFVEPKTQPIARVALKPSAAQPLPSSQSLQSLELSLSCESDEP